MSETTELQERMNAARRAEARKLQASIVDWSALKEYALRNMEICKNDAMGIDPSTPSALAHLARAQGRYEELKRLYRLDADVEKRLKTPEPLDFKE